MAARPVAGARRPAAVPVRTAPSPGRPAVEPILSGAGYAPAVLPESFR